MTTAVNPDAANAAAAASAAAANAAEAQAAIPVLREQIDALDEAIIRLVAERARVSRRIQTARINAGGTRVELGRERVVHANYRDGLGPDGPHLADALLQVCRGTR
ncbi:chorismate mutase [Jatrophihabitans sp.]|uniref:chorismate mutase n=1 Tax=Jatrophihabitans sp. TaxID=1932789 RepID=UPI0030C6E954|nr:chorismate mutase [Jatrophihabitans sp.]